MEVRVRMMAVDEAEGLGDIRRTCRSRVTASPVMHSQTGKHRLRPATRPLAVVSEALCYEHRVVDLVESYGRCCFRNRSRPHHRSLRRVSRVSLTPSRSSRPPSFVTRSPSRYDTSVSEYEES